MIWREFCLGTVTLLQLTSLQCKAPWVSLNSSNHPKCNSSTLLCFQRHPSKHPDPQPCPKDDSPNNALYPSAVSAHPALHLSHPYPHQTTVPSLSPCPPALPIPSLHTSPSHAPLPSQHSPVTHVAPPRFPRGSSRPSPLASVGPWGSADAPSCISARLGRSPPDRIRRESCVRAFSSSWVPEGRSRAHTRDRAGGARTDQCVGIGIHLRLSLSVFSLPSLFKNNDRTKGQVGKDTGRIEKVRSVPPLLQYPLRTKKLHSGIFLRLYSCKNSQLSPFLHRPRSQCLQTRLLKLLLLLGVTWRSGHAFPKGQCPCRYALQIGRVGGIPNRCEASRNGLKENV